MMKCRITYLVALLMIGVLASSASATLFVLQEGDTDPGTGQVYGETEDTYLRGLASGGWVDRNMGTHKRINLGWSSADQRGLVRFGLSDVIASGNTTASGAGTLVLTLIDDNAGDGAMAISLYAIASADGGWIEGAKDSAAATAGEPTWNNRAHPSTAWAGGLGMGSLGGATLATLIGTSNPTGGSEGDTLTFTIPEATIQSWLDGNNYGLGLAVNYISDIDAQRYYSSENSDAGGAAKRPELSFNATPEPVTLALLAIGGLAALIRRRR